MRAKWLAMILALLLGGAGGIHAQILVAPIQLFLSSRAPLGTFYVYNQSQQAQEVSVSFRFGYPVSGDSGGIGMVYGDTLPLKDRSMQAWVRAFPKQFVLAPGQRQEVRITTRAPQDVPEGMYWTRIVTTSAPQAPPLDTLAPGVSARITFRLEQVTTVLFGRGRVQTAVTADSPRVSLDSSRVLVLTRVAPGGNAPFFGTTRLRILSDEGAEVDASTMKFAMYQPMVLRSEFPRQKLPKGRYVAELRIVSERDDISPQDMLRIEPVVRSVSFTVP